MNAPDPNAEVMLARTFNDRAQTDGERAAALRALMGMPGDRGPLAQEAVAWREALIAKRRAFETRLAATPDVKVYPTPGDDRGPYADMYGREEVPNPEYESLKSEIADLQRVIGVVEDAVAQGRR